MTKNTFLPLVIIIILILSSCRSVSIPWESEVIEANLSVEYYLIAEEYFELENYDKAVEYYTKVQHNDELASQANYKLVRSYVFLEEWVEAEKLIHRMLRGDPENSHLKILNAYILTSVGKTEKAIQVYEELTSAEYYDPIILKNTVLLYVYLENYEKAQIHFELFKERFPDHEYSAELEEAVQPPVVEEIDEGFEETELTDSELEVAGDSLEAE